MNEDDSCVHVRYDLRTAAGPDRPPPRGPAAHRQRVVGAPATPPAPPPPSSPACLGRLLPCSAPSSGRPSASRSCSASFSASSSASSPASMGTVGDGEANWLTTTLETVGDTFVTLLKTLVRRSSSSPSSRASPTSRQVTNAARLAGQTLLWFAHHGAISVGIGIALGLLTDPGQRTSVAEDAAADPSHHRLLARLPHRPRSVELPRSQRRVDLEDGGAIDTALSFNVLQLVVDQHRRRHRCAEGRRARRAVPRLRPLVRSPSCRRCCGGSSASRPSARVGLIGTAVATYGWDALSPLGVFAVDVYVGLRARAVRALPGAARGRTGSTRSGSSPARGPRSSSPSCRARRSAPCR